MLSQRSWESIGSPMRAGWVHYKPFPVRWEKGGTRWRPKSENPTSGETSREGEAGKDISHPHSALKPPLLLLSVSDLLCVFSTFVSYLEDPVSLWSQIDQLGPRRTPENSDSQLITCPGIPYPCFAAQKPLSTHLLHLGQPPRRGHYAVHYVLVKERTTSAKKGG